MLSPSTSSPAIFSFRCPETWPFPIHNPASDAHLSTPSLCLEIQLVRGALLHWEEIWARKGTQHTPVAPQGCSSREPLPPHKGPWAGYIPHALLSVTASHSDKTSVAPCAAGGEIQETSGDCQVGPGSASHHHLSRYVTAQALLLQAWVWLVIIIGDLNRRGVTPESPPAGVQPQQGLLLPCMAPNANAALQA